MKLDENKVQSFFKIIKEEKIRTVFQPIVSLETGEAVAYEALSRITLENTGITIDKLFDMANQLGQVWNLEKLCRRKALERAAKKPGNCKLFLNVDCNVIMDQEFVCGFTREFLKKFDLKTEDLVFELTERTSVEAEKMFLRTVEHYKTQGFEIAIDDAGTGYSNLNRISYVEPHYIKIDMGLIRNIHLSKSKSSMVRVINHFCREMNMIAIAEGVETEEELQAVIKLGVSYAQGYFFQRPQDTFCTISDEKKEKLAEIRKKVQDYNYVPSFLGTIESLASVGCTISPDRKASEAYELFEKNEELLEICVVDEEGYFCGILTRQDVLKQFGGRYGFTLNQKHTVASIMRKDTLAVDYHFSVENVSKIAMERPIKEIYDAVVVLNEGRYYGIVTIKNLLETAVIIQVQRATEANPLTALPGNTVIESQIQNLIGKKEPFSILYLDLDNFKAYNDAYGFNSGDRMIKTVAESMAHAASKKDFLGHIGGDDFVMITDSHKALEIGEKVINHFKSHIQFLYNQKDWERGYIISKNRNGLTEEFPIASLSVAAVTNQKRVYETLEALSEKIIHAKKEAKKQTGNSIVII